MSQFDFLSVLVSIIFGLGMTQLCSGAVQLAYRRHLTQEQIAYTGFTFLLLVVNWWVFFSWHTAVAWTFEAFLVLVFWALGFYAMAITLYPPESAMPPSYQTHYRRFLWANLVAIIFDITQTAMRGRLFAPAYYVPFVGQYAVLITISIWTRNQLLRRIIAWWFLFSIALWSLVVRRFLE